MDYKDLMDKDSTQVPYVPGLLHGLSKGDTAVRWIANIFPQELVVTDVDEELGIIYCGPWQFDRNSGAEIDDALEWGEQGTGSILRLKTEI